MGNEPNETKNDPPPDQELLAPQLQGPAPESGGYFGWFLLEIFPIPIGLLVGSIRVFESYQNGPNGLFFFFVIIALLCSVVGAIGQFGGFKKRSLKNIVVGIAVGIWIAVFDVVVVFFAGCCAVLSDV